MDLGIALQLALITAIAFVCQWAAWRIKLPAILPLLLSGIAIGPLLGLLDPNRRLCLRHVHRRLRLLDSDLRLLMGDVHCRALPVCYTHLGPHETR